MFAYIKGTVADVLLDRAVIETNGVGYELICSQNTLKRMLTGTEFKALVHFQMSQDAVALYGFHDEEERTMFRRLITISKIGPKTAINALSVLTPQDIVTAVLTENTAVFDNVSGIGKKTAARVLLELKSTTDFADVSGGFAADSDAPDDKAIRTEAVAALVALGYDGVSAGRAVASLPDADRVEDMITAALKQLAKSR